MGAGVEKAHPWWLGQGCAVRNPPKSSEGGSGPVLGLEMAWPTRSKCLCVSPRTTVGLGSGGPSSKDSLPCSIHWDPSWQSPRLNWLVGDIDCKCPPQASPGGPPLVQGWVSVHLAAEKEAGAPSDASPMALRFCCLQVHSSSRVTRPGPPPLLSRAEAYPGQVAWLAPRRPSHPACSPQHSLSVSSDAALRK